MPLLRRDMVIRCAAGTPAPPPRPLLPWCSITPTAQVCHESLTCSKPPPTRCPRRPRAHHLPASALEHLWLAPSSLYYGVASRSIQHAPMSARRPQLESVVNPLPHMRTLARMCDPGTASQAPRRSSTRHRASVRRTSSSRARSGCRPRALMLPCVVANLL